jgi:acetyl esterase/lipase
MDCLLGIPDPRIEPERLPLGILYYRAAAIGPRPALIDIHGGAWQHGSPADNGRFHRYMAGRGFTVFSIDYRLAPAVKFPAQLEDVRAAIRFVLERASLYRIDPARITLCGRSAGGELALLAAYEKGGVPIHSVISFYGPSDLTRGYNEPPSPDPLHVRGILETYLGGVPAMIPEVYRAASPAAYVRAMLPPTLLIQGKRDHIVKPQFARDLYRALIASGNRATLLELPWSEHAFDAVFSGPGNQAALAHIERFLR